MTHHELKYAVTSPEGSTVRCSHWMALSQMRCVMAHFSACHSFLKVTNWCIIGPKLCSTVVDSQQMSLFSRGQLQHMYSITAQWGENRLCGWVSVCPGHLTAPFFFPFVHCPLSATTTVYSDPFADSFFFFFFITLLSVRTVQPRSSPLPPHSPNLASCFWTWWARGPLE